MVNLYEAITIGVAIAGTIIIPIVLAVRPQDIVFKLIRHESIVEKPIKSRIALEVSHPDKPIKKCRVIYNGTELPCDENPNQNWSPVFAQGSALFRIPLDMEDEDAKVIVKNGWHTLQKTRLGNASQVQPLTKKPSLVL